MQLVGSQVAGLYNPDDKHLYVVSKSGRIGAVEKSTFSHEFTHALQDQNFDLSALKLDEIGEGDRSFARLSLVDSRPLSLLHDVEMGVTAELGRRRMTVRDLLSLTPGAVIELDRAAGSPVDVLVNGTVIARGEVVVVDEEFGIRISEIVVDGGDGKRA